MDYRDERDALRGRVANLEQELDDAKRELSEVKGETPECASPAKPSPPMSTAMIVGLFALLGVPIGGIGLCMLTIVVLAGGVARATFVTVGTVTVTGALLFLTFVASTRFEARRLRLPERPRHVGWNVLQWAALGALTASTLLLIEILVTGSDSEGEVAVCVLGLWLATGGLSAFFAGAPNIRDAPPGAS